MRGRRAPWWMWAPPALVLLWVLAGLRVPARPDGADVSALAGIPVLDGGRIKPIDSVGRTALLTMSGRQSVRVDGRTIPPAEWLLDMAARPDVADRYRVFLVDDPDVKSVAGVAREGRRRFAFEELEPALAEIDAQADRAAAVAPEVRDRFQRAIVLLRDRLVLYRRLQHTLQPAGARDFGREVEAYERVMGPGVRALLSHQRVGPFDRAALNALGAFFSRFRALGEAAAFRALPPPDGAPADAWETTGGGLLEGLRTGELRPGIREWTAILAAWRAQDPVAFNHAVAAWRVWLAQHRPAAVRRAAVESWFNRAALFAAGMAAYVLAALLLAASWLVAGSRSVEAAALARSARLTLALGFAVHTVGLAVRMWLQGRPPVTNLYASAVFVGWAAVGLGWWLERRHRTGVPGFLAGGIGFATLLIAHHLAQQGDSLEMMRAVLDSNFWLATHVTTVTIGYASTFLAGGLGLFYVLRGALFPGFRPEAAEGVARMAYGVICFSLFFSFTGTVLGGIWADQSWGRFWGWDPKENGALLIVLWNALILHARWGRLVGERGVMIMAIGGNVVTALSWFGVNMLGIGLHSYGFMDKAFVWLAVFVLSQLAAIGVGLMPADRWRSRLV